jgi:hypothetical protein
MNSKKCVFSIYSVFENYKMKSNGMERFVGETTNFSFKWLQISLKKRLYSVEIKKQK